jgi:hypothetical protein
MGGGGLAPAPKLMSFLLDVWFYCCYTKELFMDKLNVVSLVVYS